jgi:NADH-quinone oxidoreductase subunit M
MPKAQEEAPSRSPSVVSLVGFAAQPRHPRRVRLGRGGCSTRSASPGSRRSARTTTSAIDGISLPLFVLSYLLTFLCSVYCFHHIEEPGQAQGVPVLMLLLQTGMAGCFIAFDLVLFFIFWELVLVPMYFMIGIWGGPRREYAAVKFFLYTLFGSVFMLVAFLALGSPPAPSTWSSWLPAGARRDRRVRA